METSVIIRVKNEGAIFNKVLSALKAQSDQSFDLVIVDDNSSDGTDKLPFQYFPANRIKVVKVPLGKFSHPYSSNLGAQNSRGKYLAYLNGHSVPKGETWLIDGLNNFKDNKVAGVFAYPLANQEANLFERFIYSFYAKFFSHKRKVYRKAKMGLLGTTNAIIRKDLWSEYNFNESFRMGGEDTDWAEHWLERGCVIVQDPKFRTYHSHNLSPLGFIRQALKWRRMLKSDCL